METIWVEKFVQEGDEWKWVMKPEQFNTEEDFSIDEGNLNLEICRMGQLMVRYGDLAAHMSSNLKRKEEEVKFVQAKVSGAIRSTAEAAGTKQTEGKLNEQVVTNDQYQNALAQLHVLRASATKADHWWRSIVKKADLLNAMAFRQNAEIKRMPG